MAIALLLVLTGISFILTGITAYVPIILIKGFHIPLWLLITGIVGLVAWLIGD